MSDEKPFTIDAVEWHLRVPGNPEPRERILERFQALASFLDSNGLSRARLLPDGRLPDDRFAVRSTDLTPEGLALMRSAYERWLKAIGRGAQPTDTKILQRALAKLREG